MRREVAGACAALAALALGAAVAAAAGKADFSGTWVMDAAKSEGIPAGMKQTLKITQKDDRIDVEARLTLPDGTERTINDSFTADGKEAPFKPFVMGGPEPKNAKRTTKWAADRAGIDVVENSEVDTPEGADTLQMIRKWTLSEDGKTLTIEQDFKGPMGSQQSKRVFTKQ